MSLKDKIMIDLLPPAAALLLKGLWASMRINEVNKDIEDSLLAKQRSENQGFIYAIWHSRMLLPTLSNTDGRCHYALISRHQDGQIAGKIAGRFHFEMVEGSSTRGGDQAFRQLAHLIKAGKNVVMTPDGPRGPDRTVKPGIIRLAQLTGSAILPYASSASPAGRLKSWDRFLIPYPFSRGVLVRGEPIYPRKTKDLKIQDYYVRKLEDELNRVTDLADNWFPPARPNIPLTIKSPERIQTPEPG